MPSLTTHAFEVVADDTLAVTGLLQDVAAGSVVPPVVSLEDANGQPTASDTLVFISADSLSLAAPVVKAAAKRHHLSGLIVETADPEWYPQTLHDAGLRTVRNTLLHHPDDLAVRRRILHAHLLNARDELVARVRVVGDTLVLLTCGLQEVRVPFEAHPALRRLPISERSHVHLSEEGHRLSWGDGHVQVDLDGLRHAVDPDYAAAVDLDATFRGGFYGAAIREMREAHHLRQIDIDGVSSRQVRRIERDGTASLAALGALAEAHHLSLDAYLDALADRVAELKAAPTPSS